MKPSKKYAVAVSVTRDGQGKVAIHDGKGNRITVCVSPDEDYVSVDAYRNGEPYNNFDVDFVGELK